MLYSQLLDEIAKHDKEKENEQGRNDWKKTSISPYMEHFEKFIKTLKNKRKYFWIFCIAFIFY